MPLLREDNLSSGGYQEQLLSLLWRPSYVGVAESLPTPTESPSPVPTATPQPEDPIDRYDWDTTMARCIRWRESRDDPTRVSETDDWGWFQIHRGPIQNPDGTWWEGWEAYFIREWGEWNPLDPEWNTRAAYHIFNDRAGRTWGPWTTGVLCI